MKLGNAPNLRTLRGSGVRGGEEGEGGCGGGGDENGGRQIRGTAAMAYQHMHVHTHTPEASPLPPLPLRRAPLTAAEEDAAQVAGRVM